MNTYLEKLFDEYWVSPKNRYEISQIYSLLNSEKQQNIIKNFENIAKNLEKIEKKINTEREILIPESIKRIKKVIEKVKIENKKI